jgi:molybdopterin-containing oxidoreductase family iron-sulfur binding subunit
VREGEIQTACQQACPSEAIHFGNLRDTKSRVSELRREARAFQVLDHLYTRPGVSYLKSIERAEDEA